MEKKPGLMDGVLIFLVAAALVGLGCQTSGAGWRGQKPLLYPNAHLKSVGEAAAQGDIAQCQYMAQSGPTQRNTGEDAAVNTLGGAAVGAALGAIGGAIAGNAGTGAAAGAAVGGGGGGGTGAFSRGCCHAVCMAPRRPNV